ncbi:MAG: hypothetical protein INR70_14080 [Parafilimonas terrae]|nr:hypothetical protein [Parafilimonas terrae]
MRSTVLSATVACGLACSAPLAARADTTDDILRAAVYEGPLTSGVARLESIAEPKARFALGASRLVLATEHLAQGLYRHGLSTPPAAIPILRIPVPPNRTPEPLTYDGFRSILTRFDADLGSAQAALETVGDGPISLPVDLSLVRIDLDGDGIASEPERLWPVLAAIDPEPAAGTGPAEASRPDGGYPVTFDAGDVPWMLGYVHVLRSIVTFWLAHDFSAQFEQTYHAFFPHAGLPFSDAPTIDTPLDIDGASLADLVAFVHLLNCPVTDKARLGQALAHLRAVPALSRKSWTAILAETDDDHEWLPNPRQTNRFPSLPVTEVRIAAWLKAMDLLEEVLDGRKLVPHWRFTKGVNVKRAILDHERFDPVLWATGTGVAPFLADGPTLSADEWNGILQAFGSSFGGYAAWFN